MVIKVLGIILILYYILLLVNYSIKLDIITKHRLPYDYKVIMRYRKIAVILTMVVSISTIVINYLSATSITVYQLAFSCLLVLIALLINIFTIVVKQKNKSTAYLTTNIYKYSRNPIALSLFIFTLAIILIYPTLQIIAAFLIQTVLLHLEIKNEEKIYNTYYPKYIDYKLKVPRYIFINRN